MTRRDSAPLGAPCWIDLTTSDVGRARDFYTRLFGWTAGEGSPEFGGYFMFFKDGVPVAGGAPTPPGMDVPDNWKIYVAVEDATKTVESAQAHGGQAVVAPMDVADLGRMAVIADPGGATIGLWQAGAFSGFGVLGEPDAPGWFELHTRDYANAIAFYRDVFDWDIHTVGDTPEFRYSTVGAGDAAQAGMMDGTPYLPADEPNRWTLYFGVADTDATLAKITELGGTVVRPGEDTPYGRLAEAVDPTGTWFKLVGPNAAGS